MDNFEALPGGVVRVSVGADRDAQPQPIPQGTGPQQGGTFRISGDHVVHDRVAQYVHRPEPLAPGGSVMATLRNSVGGQQIDRTSTVELPGGMRTSLQVAESMGYIRRTSQDTYEDTTQAPTASTGEPMQDAPAQQSMEPELAGAEDEADWQADIEPLPQYAYDAATAGAAAAVVSGDPEAWDRVARGLAANSGIDPAMAADFVEVGYSFFEQQVSAEFAKLGIEGETKERAYAWLQTSKPQELQRAIQELTTMRRLDVFRRLAVDFKVSNPGDLEVYKRAGFDVWVDRDTGDVMVRRDAGQPVRARDLR